MKAAGKIGYSSIIVRKQNKIHLTENLNLKNLKYRKM